MIHPDLRLQDACFSYLGRGAVLWLVKCGCLLLCFPGILILGAQPVRSAQSRTSDQQLFQAVARGDVGSARVLLDNGADIESKDERGSTPLMTAVEHSDIAMVKALLDRGANISARNTYEDTPLTEAARDMNPEMVRVLLTGNPKLKDKNAALLEAAKEGPVVIQMIDAPATPGGRDEQPANTASEPPWVTVVRLLLDSGAELEARDEEGDTPLMQAAGYGQAETFKVLLERGAKINVRDKRGMTPLIAAACACAIATMNSTYDIMKSLLENGAAVNARTHDGTTALMMAAGSPDGPASVVLLLSRSADPMAKNNEGKTALTFAKGGAFPEKVRLLKRAMAHAR